MKFETIEECDKVLKLYTDCEVPEPTPIKIKVDGKHITAYFVPELTLNGFDYESMCGFKTKEIAQNEIETEIDITLKSAEFHKTQFIKENKERNEIDKRLFYVYQFTESMTPLQKGRVVKVLSTKKWYENEIMTRSEFIENLIYSGWKVVTIEGKRYLKTCNNVYIDEKAITKTGMDYAQFLFNIKITL